MRTISSILIVAALAGGATCVEAQNVSVNAVITGEVVPGAEFYTYADKYEDDAVQLLTPAPLTGGPLGFNTVTLTRILIGGAFLLVV